MEDKKIEEKKKGTTNKTAIIIACICGGVFFLFIICMLVLPLLFVSYSAKKVVPHVKEIREKIEEEVENQIEDNKESIACEYDTTNVDVKNLTLENKCGDNELITNEPLIKCLKDNQKNILNEANEFLINDKIKSNLFYYLNKSTKINELSNQNKLLLIRDYVGYDIFETTNSNVLLSMMKSIYGSSFNVNFEDINDLLNPKDIMWKYDSDKKEYDFVGLGYGFPSISIANLKPVKFEEKNGKYYISYKVLLQKHSSGPNGYCNTDFEDISLEFTPVNSSDTDCYIFTPNNYQIVEKNLKPITFVFEKEQGNLVLTEYIK